ncbi:hypothetical protein JX265_005169 [Neoarthrinium moseri]|uniref:Amidohydrolase-related domain-containing protein n=1 Tax=Neoarthrinium moseri TaxID=1658444 RepID=A0A9Q0AN28_9PEZI|nr:hypothetical protein JX266_010740 [Neoarthrinium moseri]KAI1873547.1 hypothetical protein JX265_005169 [Neoarthrinium moseri]
MIKFDRHKTEHTRTTSIEKFAITNVLVFDGEGVRGPETVVVENGTIGTKSDGATIVDGTGCMVLPGLIDTHVHIVDETELQNCARYGVTTACDLGAYPKSLFEKLKKVNGPTEYLSSGLAAFPPQSLHAQFHSNLDKDMSLRPEHRVADWVEARVSECVDFIKIIADEPGFDQAVLNELGRYSRAKGKVTIAHATNYTAYERGVAADYDILTRPSRKTS